MVAPGPCNHLYRDRQASAASLGFAGNAIDQIAACRAIALFALADPRHWYDSGGKAADVGERDIGARHRHHLGGAVPHRRYRIGGANNKIDRAALRPFERTHRIRGGNCRSPRLSANTRQRFRKQSAAWWPPSAAAQWLRAQNSRTLRSALGNPAVRSSGRMRRSTWLPRRSRRNALALSAERQAKKRSFTRVSDGDAATRPAWLPRLSGFAWPRRQRGGSRARPGTRHHR